MKNFYQTQKFAVLKMDLRIFSIFHMKSFHYNVHAFLKNICRSKINIVATNTSFLEKKQRLAFT